LLAEEGIGGERSSGAGKFTPEWLDLPSQWQEIINFDQPNCYSLISLFWQSPLPSDLTNASYYEIQERGGWIGSPFSGRQLRRKMVRMFTEGSVFDFLPQGQLANVTPINFQKIHNIYRSGISLSLPVCILPVKN
jgi:CRISPR-associated protein Csm4